MTRTDDMVKGWRFRGVQLRGSEISGLTLQAADISAGAVTETKLAANAVTSANIRANTIKTAAISAGTIVATDLAAGAVTSANILANTVKTAAISAGTVVNADMSSPESFFSLSTRITKIASNKTAASAAYMGKLPASAELVKVTAAASVLNNIALNSLAINVWASNGTSHLLTGSGIQISGAALAVRSGALSTVSITQAANTPIYVAARTSTTFSALGVDVVSVWKVAHTT